MSEANVAAPVVAPANGKGKAPKSKSAKKPPKKAKKVVKAKKAKGSRPARDDARLVGKASGGVLNADMVRILRALKAAGTAPDKKDISRGDIKEAVGIGRDGKYSAKWLGSLWALNEKKFIFISESEEGHHAHGHAITAKGKEVLAKAEAEAKKAAKA